MFLLLFIIIIAATQAVLTPPQIELQEQLLTYGTQGHNYEPSLINMQDNRALLLWVNYNADTNTDSNYRNTTIYGQIYFSDGVPSSDKFAINQDMGYYLDPAATVIANNRIFVTWYGAGNIYGRLFSADTMPLTDQLDMAVNIVPNNNNNFTVYRGHPIPVSLDNGNIFLVWFGNLRGTYDIYGKILYLNGTAITPTTQGDEFLISEQTQAQAIAANHVWPAITKLQNGNVFIQWTCHNEGQTVDVYGRIFSSAGVPVTDQIKLNRGTLYGSGYYITAAAINLANGNILVTWTGFTEGIASYLYSNIYGTLLSIDGTPIASANATVTPTDTRLNSHIADGCSYSDVVQLPNEDVFVVWNCNQNQGNNNGTPLPNVRVINGKVFTTDLIPKSQEEFTINTDPNITWSYDPKVILINSQNVFLVWRSVDSSYKQNIYGRILTPQAISTLMESANITTTTAIVSTSTNNSIVETTNLQSQPSTSFTDQNSITSIATQSHVSAGEWALAIFFVVSVIIIVIIIAVVILRFRMNYQPFQKETDVIMDEIPGDPETYVRSNKNYSDIEAGMIKFPSRK